ncbi:MAG: hypothetical protein AAF654_12160 [Myxococcota bacterium]
MKTRVPTIPVGTGPNRLAVPAHRRRELSDREPAFSGPTSPFPVLNRTRELLDRSGDTLVRYNIDSRSVIQNVFNRLMRGDPQGALETYDALQRLVDHDQAAEDGPAANGAAALRRSLTR